VFCITYLTNVNDSNLDALLKEQVDGCHVTTSMS